MGGVGGGGGSGAFVHMSRDVSLKCLALKTLPSADHKKGLPDFTIGLNFEEHLICSEYG